VTGAVSISDPDNLNLASATVSITGGAFTGDGGYHRGHQHQHELRQQQRAAASGSDTLAHYQSVLDQVTFAAGENFGSNPTSTVIWPPPARSPPPR
jgi:hypothetical protein